MRIGLREIDRDSAPYIIAELGVNHDGSLDRALALVDAAHRAGADAVKLQLFESDRLVSSMARLAAYQGRSGALDPRALLRSLELDAHQVQAIVSRVHALGMHPIATVFSLDLVMEAESLPWAAYKIASPDIIHRPLIEALQATGKPLILSTGAATLQEVMIASAWLGNGPHIFLQCVSAYPAPDECASLAGRIAMLEHGLPALGYSDHTTSVETAAIAVASGAVVLEKHLTHDRSARGPDHASSLDPDQFAAYVRSARRAHRMLGPRKKDVLDIEQEVRQLSRQSLTTARPLPRGHVLARQDITIKRPGSGLSPAQLDTIVGRTINCELEADVPLMQEHLA